jgi:hypothetical protein
MRTVHETEALRPSDPVPKSMQQQANNGKGNRLKIILKTPQSQTPGHEEGGEEGGDNEDLSSELITQLTEQHGFSGKELQMEIQDLWRLCVANVKWASEEGATLREQCKELEDLYRQEWLEKEVLLDQVEKTEVDWWQRRHAVLTGAADVQVGAIKAKATGDPEETDQELEDAAEDMEEDTKDAVEVEE